MTSNHQGVHGVFSATEPLFETGCPGWRRGSGKIEGDWIVESGYMFNRHYKWSYGGGNSNIFYFHSYLLGEMIPFDDHIF